MFKMRVDGQDISYTLSSIFKVQYSQDGSIYREYGFHVGNIHKALEEYQSLKNLFTEERAVFKLRLTCDGLKSTIKSCKNN